MLQAANLLRPSARLYPDQWGAKNRTYPPTSGMPGPRNPGVTAYLIPFGRKGQGGRYTRAVAVTAAQSGKTETFLDVIGSKLDQKPAPILYVGPSQDFVTDQFEPRLMALLEEAPVLAAKVARGKAMKKTQKWIAGVKVRLGFAGSSTSLKSDSFALGLVDEYDEMMSNIKGQGDPLGLADARGETYADFMMMVTSTPSLGLVQVEIDPVNGLEFWAIADPEQVESPIWRLFQQGTRHHFAWPCPHCDAFFIPKHKHLKWPKGSTPAQARRTAYVECPNCGGIIEDHHKPEMIAGGVQIAPGQTIADAHAEANEPDNVTWSCWTSGLCSPFVTFGGRAHKYLQALETGEPDKIQTSINANFGECYSIAADADQPEWEDIRKRSLPYAENEIPEGGLRLLMAVDVQRFSLIYVIRAFGARGTSWLITKGQLYGTTDQDPVWDDLADLMLSPISGMQIEKVAVDSGFRPNKPDGVNEHKVYEFCRRYPWLCVPTKGRDVQNPPYQVSKIEVKPDGKRPKYSINLAWLSTDFFKSLVLSRVRTPMTATGAWYVHSDIDEDFCKQMVSEVRVIEAGKPKWLQKSRANHFLDCEAMVAAMAYTLNVQRIPEGVTRSGAKQVSPSDPETQDASEVANPQDQPAPPQTPPAARSGSDLRSRFAGLGGRLNRR